LIIEIPSDGKVWLQVKHALRSAGLRYYLQEQLFSTNKTLFIEELPEPENGKLTRGMVVYEGGCEVGRIKMDSAIFETYAKEIASE
jgi:hypothetical protein